MSKFSKSMKALITVLALGLSFSLCAVSAFAATYYADASKPDDSGDGLSPETAKRHIQAAVDLCATAGDTVKVAEGLYNEGVNVCSYDSVRARVVITNKLHLVATGSKEKTIIEGAFDGTETGVGPNAVRGVYVYYTGSGTSGKRTAGSIVEGFTICKGATEAGGAGGGLSIWMSYAANCIVSNCVAKRGGGVYQGTAVRCLVTDCASGGSSEYGTASQGTAYLNSIVVRQRGAARLFYVPGLMVNCTVAGNNGVDFGYTEGTVALRNTIVTDNAFNKFYFGSKPVASNCVFQAGMANWNAANCGNIHTNESAYGFAAPAFGDWRPAAEMGAADVGDAEFLQLFTLPEELEDQRYVDYYGNAIATAGAITCGAAQSVYAPQKGLVKFDSNTGWEIAGYGSLPTVCPEINYLWADDYPGMFKIRKEGASFTNLAWYLQYTNGVSWARLNPDMANWTGFVVKEGVTNTVSVLNPDKVLYVAPSGDDDNNTGDYESPFATIQKAIESTPNGKSSAYKSSVIIVRKGTYATGGTTSARMHVLNKTGDSTWWYKNLRIVAEEGVANTTVCGARGTDEGGYGEGALACCRMQLPTLVQGFTLTGGYKSFAGAAVYGNTASYCHVADCLLTGNQGGEAIAYTVGLYRCRLADNVLTASTAGEVKGSTPDNKSSVVNCEVVHSVSSTAGSFAIAEYVNTAFSAVNGSCNGGTYPQNLYFGSILPGGQSLGGVNGAKYCFAEGEPLSGTVDHCQNGKVKCVSFAVGDFRLKSNSPALEMVTFDPDVCTSLLCSLDMDGNPLKLKARAGNTAGPRQAWSVERAPQGSILFAR